VSTVIGTGAAWQDPTLHKPLHDLLKPIWSIPAIPAIPGLIVHRFSGAAIARPGNMDLNVDHEEISRTTGMPWYPAQSEHEWHYMKLLYTSGLSNTRINEFLHLDMVSQLESNAKRDTHI
jgi:hypothetical protein